MKKFYLALSLLTLPLFIGGCAEQGDEQNGQDDTAYIEMNTMDMNKHLTGDNYDLHSSVETASNPLGEWNHAMIIVNGAHVEHWLNGVQTVAYELWTEEWEELVRASKFADYPEYGRAMSGHIGLQDHGHTLRYRNIKLRSIEP